MFLSNGAIKEAVRAVHTGTGTRTGGNNIAFGLLYLVFTVALGIYLARSADGQTAWAFGPVQLSVLSGAYLHANLDGAVNIVAGYFINRLPFVGWVTRALSYLLIIGALLHSGAMYIAGFGLLPYAAGLAPAGALVLAAVTLFMAIGALGMKAAR